MRQISRIALIALSSMFVTSGIVAAGCGDGVETPPTTSKGTSSSSSGEAGAGGTAGKGGMGGAGGKAGAGGMGGFAGSGGMAGMGGAGGANCSSEVCDGVDNDCDQEIDEGCLCVDGDKQPCYDGDPTTSGVGVCVAGTQACDLTGMFGACVGQVLPSPEVCNGLDDDCNANVDDGLGTTTCGIGACQVTVDNCSNGMLNTCVPLPPAPMEACDGTDDNCNGEVDEGCMCVDGTTQSCYTGPNGTEDVGTCKAGTQTCVNGMWSSCMGAVVPTNETCNGLDDDCDMSTDEELGVSVCGVGACQATVDNCSAGKPQTCVPGTPQTEVCDGADNDCDIGVDEDLGTTSCGVGACAATVPACVNGQNNPCVPGMPTTEACDGIDNDCNGAVDNGNPGGGGPCMTGNLGVCAAGTNNCVAGQIVCTQNTQSSAELCDGLDNNCDGMVDDNPAQVGTPCMTGVPGVCAAGTRQCNNGMLACVPTTMASAETCDGLDNDCDGQSDEGNPGGGQNCNTGNLGICAAGSTSCVGGQIVCNQNTAPNVELCDGLDNDCDGTVDDNPQQVGTPCQTGQQGVCAAGTRACTNGMLVCNSNVNSSAEVCDSLDNDCDGTVDDTPATVGDPCTTGLNGVCAAGTKVCTNGMISCSQTTQPSAEVCDGLDNDCNGAVDNGNPGGAMACTTGQLGVCAPGTTSCTGGAVVCNRNTNPSAETCDGLDNDCNGTVDNGNPGGGVNCNTGQQGICAPGTTACTGGAIVCNRNNNPSTEACDGLDNDCNGVVDNGNPGGAMMCNTGQLGVCAPGTTSCTGGTVVCNRDTNPSVEVCDGLDNDCNGTVDNGNPGGGANCNTGQQGICSAGTTSCTMGAIVCNRNNNPSTETCDGLDNDCNGIVDNGNPGGGANCNTGQPGICSAGTTACTNGSVLCNQNNTPSTEVCDGLDNDCNGVVDNGNPGGAMMCNTGQLGVCAPGTTACTGGTVVCNRNTNPGAEVCDGLDNDCNGVVDNNPATVGDACTTGLSGVCAAGTKICTNGMIACSQTTQSSSEVCDGLDNDCNGAVDNGNPGGGMACTTGQQGACSAGTTACSSGSVVCNRNNNPSAEICDGIDNDCDGSIDEGNPGGGMGCNTGLSGLCGSGLTACSSGAIVCTQTVFPTTEACDNLDNDCNGVVDNGNPGGGVGCSTGQSGICSAGTTACSMGMVVCNRNQNPSADVCDGLDNDCNGTVDQGNPGGGMACNTGQSGICSAGTTACTSGAIVCNRNLNPSSEICDGLDNDCDAQLDETDPNTTCPAQNPGAGGVSTWTCPIGTCTVTACQAGRANIDGNAVNGCECVTDTYSNTCAGATSTNVSVGATVTLNGKIETAAGSDWVQVTFADRPIGQPYHPKIELTVNPGGQYAMDVMTTCTTVAACSTAGNGVNNESGTNVSIWEHFNNKYVPGAGCCSDQTPHVTAVFVRVYRKNGDAPTCDQYTVTATNL